MEPNEDSPIKPFGGLLAIGAGCVIVYVIFHELFQKGGPKQGLRHLGIFFLMALACFVVGYHWIRGKSLDKVDGKMWGSEETPPEPKPEHDKSKPPSEGS